MLKRVGLSWLLSILSCASAWALPDVVAQQGYVLDAQGPVNGEHSVRIRIFNAAIGGRVLFEEVHNNVTFTDGYYHILVGSVNRLDGNLFTQPELYYAMTIDDGDDLHPPVPFWCP